MNSPLLRVATIAFMLSAPTLSFGADDQFAEGKRLYLAAQYEEALAVLAGAGSSSSGDLNEYRVLCLLELKRRDEAERIIEGMILNNPLATLDLSNRSLKFATTYLGVRSRVLPLIARTMYALAKASFEAGKFAIASVQFQELVTLIEQQKERMASLGNLDLLADGFLKLSQRHSEPPATPADSRAHSAPGSQSTLGPQTASGTQSDAAMQAAHDELVAIETEPDRTVAAVPESKPFAPWRPQIFGPENQDVTPPGPIEQQMPAWNVAGTSATVVFDGSLEVLIDEHGLVTSAKMIKWSHPAYDSTLVSAARRWRYSPAVKDGRPVRYRKVIDFTLRGR